MNYICKYRSPLGDITLSADNIGLTGLWFDGQKYYAAPTSCVCREPLLPVFVETRRWLDCYFSGVAPSFFPSIHIDSTLFRTTVWDILRTIPYGTTTTYKSISLIVARRLGIPSMSAQAVGGAVAHNPISIIIPCHRVVAADGALTGYAGGIDRKRSLLMLERSGIFGV